MEMYKSLKDGRTQYKFHWVSEMEDLYKTINVVLEEEKVWQLAILASNLVEVK
jgi:hypothetical protein